MEHGQGEPSSGNKKELIVSPHSMVLESVNPINGHYAVNRHVHNGCLGTSQGVEVFDSTVLILEISLAEKAPSVIMVHTLQA